MNNQKQKKQEIQPDSLSTRKMVVKETFGKLKLKLSTEQIMKEIDRELWGE